MIILSRDDQEKEKLKANPVERSTLSIIPNITLENKYHKSNNLEN